ncbi:MAG: hypothetical protein KBF19_03590 [Negativicutes bacterium]|nr:hypothetical protein [Negativicutes bacterium]
MSKKIFPFLIAFLLCFIPTGLAKTWLDVGSMGSQDMIWMDPDIRPVALPDGKTIVPNIYTSYYKTSLQDRGYLFTNSLIDLQSNKFFSLDSELQILGFGESKYQTFPADNFSWQTDRTGADGFLYMANLLKNKAKIDKKKPFKMTEEQASLGDRAPEWPIDSNGWQQVYLQPNGNRAWIQTSSVQFSKGVGKLYPMVRVLVWRENIKADSDQSSKRTLSYEQYDPNLRTRSPLMVWGIQPNSTITPLVFRTRTPYPVTVLSPDAAIATLAYAHGIVHLKENPVFFEPQSSPQTFPNEWLKISDIN